MWFVHVVSVMWLMAGLAGIYGAFTHQFLLLFMQWTLLSALIISPPSLPRFKRLNIVSLFVACCDIPFHDISAVPGWGVWASSLPFFRNLWSWFYSPGTFRVVYVLCTCIRYPLQEVLGDSIVPQVGTRSVSVRYCCDCSSVSVAISLFSCTSVSVCRPVIDVCVFTFAFRNPLQTVAFRINVPGVRSFLSTHPFPFPKISPSLVNINWIGCNFLLWQTVIWGIPMMQMHVFQSKCFSPLAVEGWAGARS